MVLGYGMSIPPPELRHADLTPLIAMIAAILLVRFVVGIRLTPMSAVQAAFVGALWAYLAEPWGLVIPSALAVVVVALLRVHVGSRGPNRS